MRPPLDKSVPVAVEVASVASASPVTLPRLKSLHGKLVAFEKLDRLSRLHLRALQSFLLHEIRRSSFQVALSDSRYPRRFDLV